MNSVFSGMIWKFIERTAAQLVSFVVTIVLARILLPYEYGIIAKVMVFITIADVFVTTGVASALIQKKDADELDFSTMFYINILLSISMYLLIIAGSNRIAEFFRDAQIVPILRVLGLKVILSAGISIQQAYISRYMIFQKSTIATLSATIGSAIVGIVLAKSGFGVWSLVWQQMSMAIIQTIFLMILIEWKPKAIFSWNRAKSMIGFGNMVLLAGILDTIGSQLKTIVVGRFYNDEELAFFNRGDLFPQTVISSISSAMHTVLFAAYSKEQDSVEVIKNMVRKGVRYGTYIIFSMLIGLACVAKPLIEVLLTSKWLACVPFLQLACVAYCSWPIQIVEQEAIIGLGYGKDYLIITIKRVAVSLIILLALSKYSVFIVSIGVILSNYFSTVLICRWVHKYLDYTYAEQIADIIPAILVSGVIALVVLGISLTNIKSTILLLIVEIVSGSIAFITYSIVTKNETFYWIVKKIIKRYY